MTTQTWLDEITGADGMICIDRSNLSGLLARHQAHPAVRRAMDELMAPKVRERYRQARRAEIRANREIHKRLPTPPGSSTKNGNGAAVAPDPDKELSGEQRARDLAFTLDHLSVSFSRKEAEEAAEAALHPDNGPGERIGDRAHAHAWWRR